MRCSRIAATYLIICVMAATAQADPLATYDFATDLSASGVPAGISATDAVNNMGTGFSTEDITITNLAGANAINPVLRMQNIHIDIDDGLSFPDPAVSESYWSISLTGQGANTLDVDALDFDFGPGGTSRRGYVLTYSTDSFATHTVLDPFVAPLSGSASAADFEHYTYSGLGITDAAEVEFRWYTFANDDTGRNMFWDNVVVDGSLNVIPEPNTIALVLLGSLGALVVRRSRS